MSATDEPLLAGVEVIPKGHKLVSRFCSCRLPSRMDAVKRSTLCWQSRLHRLDVLYSAGIGRQRSVCAMFCGHRQLGGRGWS